jgi:predicted O-methyltransferase YrrM
MYKFDHDWFSPNVSNLKNLAQGNEQAPLKILEIGSFEGMSTMFLAEHFPQSQITCVDTWLGSVEHVGNPEIDFVKAKANFDFNISQFPHRIHPIQGNSFDVLIDLYNKKHKFDLVYVDGAHDAVGVNSDLILSFKLLNLGGLIYCDDYYWGFNEPHNMSEYYKNFVFDTPKMGIDAFVSVYGNKLKPVLGLTNNAAVFTKVAE